MVQPLVILGEDPLRSAECDTHTHSGEQAERARFSHTGDGRKGGISPSSPHGWLCLLPLSSLHPPSQCSLLACLWSPKPTPRPSSGQAHGKKGQMLSAVQSKEGVHKQHHRAMSQQCGSVSSLSVRNHQTSVWWEGAAWLASFPLVYILRRRIIVLRTIHFYFLGIKKNVLLLHSGSIV